MNSSKDPFREQRLRFGLPSQLVPANFRPQGLEESGFFYGLYHFFGNVEEIVILPGGSYGAVGGRSLTSLATVCSSKEGFSKIEPSESKSFRDLRGFRLVVYPSAPAARAAGEDRVESKEFGKELRKAPVKQPKDAREAPEGSEGK